MCRLHGRRSGKLRKSLSHLREDVGDIDGACPQVSSQRVEVAIVKIGTDNLDPGPEWRRAVALIAATSEYLRALQTSMGGQLMGGARLANTRLSNQQHKAPAACKS